MAEVKAQVKDLLEVGWEVYAVDEVRLEHEAETRRMWLPKGQRTKFHVDRQKVSQSFFGALSLTNKKVKLYPIEGNQNTEQTILALERLHRETEAGKIAVVLDNARFHHAKALTGLYEPGQLLDTPIYLPPYAPDHNPAEHVWNAAKSNITKPPKKPSAHSSHTLPAAPLTTTSSTSHFAKPEAILFHDSHIQARGRNTHQDSPSSGCMSFGLI